MFINLHGTNLYMNENFLFTEKKVFFRCLKFKDANGGCKSYFIFKNGILSFCKESNQINFNGNEDLYIYEKNNVLFVRRKNCKYTLIYKDKLILEKGMVDKQYFNIEYTYLDKEPIGEGRYGVVYKLDKNIVGKVYFNMKTDNSNVCDVLLLNELFKNDIHNANNFLFLPKNKIILDLDDNCEFIPFQITYDYGLNYKEIIKKNNKATNMLQIFKPFRNILSSIFYLNSKNMAHFDIKFDNITIDLKTGKYKLIDLDFVSDSFFKYTIHVFSYSNSPLITMLNYDLDNNHNAIKYNFEKCEKYNNSFHQQNTRIIASFFHLHVPFAKKLLMEYYLGFENPIETSNYTENNMFKEFKQLNLEKKELFLRYDIFSFSIMLITCIKFLNITYDLRPLIPFFELTLIQKKENLTENKIINEYDKFLSKL